MRIVDRFSFLLTSHRVRFVAAMPPLWLRRRVSKWSSFSVFAFDYPLVCNWFVRGYLDGFRMGMNATDRTCAATVQPALESDTALVAIHSVTSPFALMREASASSRVWCAGYLRCSSTTGTLGWTKMCAFAKQVWWEVKRCLTPIYSHLARIGTENDQSRTNRKE